MMNDRNKVLDAINLYYEIIGWALENDSMNYISEIEDENGITLDEADSIIAELIKEI